jgi:hypothetical protein
VVALLIPEAMTFEKTGNSRLSPTDLTWFAPSKPSPWSNVAKGARS